MKSCRKSVAAKYNEKYKFLEGAKMGNFGNFRSFSVFSNSGRNGPVRPSPPVISGPSGPARPIPPKIRPGTNLKNTDYITKFEAFNFFLLFEFYCCFKKFYSRNIGRKKSESVKNWKFWVSTRKLYVRVIRAWKSISGKILTLGGVVFCSIF